MRTHVRYTRAMPSAARTTPSSAASGSATRPPGRPAPRHRRPSAPPDDGGQAAAPATGSATAPATADRSDLDRLVAGWSRDPRFVHAVRLPAREARTAALARPLPDEVWSRLGVPALWRHQAEAIDLVREGRSVVVATGTASGKSLCYQAPIAEAVCAGLRPSTSLLLYPTKALAQDQLRAFGTLEVPGLVAATYDGDTPTDHRGWVRTHANVLLTNPEMLHHGILPHHDRWATFLKRLSYVVVDELHVLRGIFGTHVAHLLRRLRRLAAHYGASPTFVFTSATIGQPERLAADLCGLPVVPVTDDGAPRGERIVVLWNPEADPVQVAADPSAGDLDADPDGGADAGPTPAPPQGRDRSTALLAASLIRAGRRTIVFSRSRKGTELLAKELGRRLPSSLAGAVRPYRGGYLAEERRAIEEALFDGQLQGVVATTALELGVDIGGLDACVLDGFPGTIASLWQQIGRSGRSAQQSVAVLVAGSDQLDQWLMRHPDELFTRPPEPAVVNLANPDVLAPHLACAAYELPLSRPDEQWWPGLVDEGVRSLVLADQLLVRNAGRPAAPDPRAVWTGRGWPAHAVSLRSARADELRIATAEGETIGTVDHGRAFRLVHPGAVYLHQGVSWRVAELDLEQRLVTVVPHDGGSYTQARTETDLAILATDASRAVGPVRLHLGTVRVESMVTGYRELELPSGKLLHAEALDLPPSELVTRAFWYTVPPSLLVDAFVLPADVPGTLHAVEHAAIGMLPLFTICDRWDVGGVSTALLDDTGLPTIVIYDGFPGGAGVAELGYEAGLGHLTATLDVIAGCGCDTGCPSCVQSPKCGNGNEPLDKAGAARLLSAIVTHS